MTLPMALAVPADVGMVGAASELLTSFPTVLVSSWITLARKAKLLVVQRALLAILRGVSLSLWSRLITNMRASAEHRGATLHLSPCW